jgi:hypothetical protein
MVNSTKDCVHKAQKTADDHFIKFYAFAITCCTSNPPSSSVEKLPKKHSKIMPFDVWDAKRIDEPRVAHMRACMMEQYHRFCHRFQLKLTPCDLKFSKENGLGASMRSIAPTYVAILELETTVLFALPGGSSLPMLYN